MLMSNVVHGELTPKHLRYELQFLHCIVGFGKKDNFTDNHER